MASHRKNLYNFPTMYHITEGTSEPRVSSSRCCCSRTTPCLFHLCRDHASQSVTSYPTRPLIGQNAQSQRGISEKSLRFLKPAVYRPTARFVRTQCKQSRRKPCVLFVLPRGIPLPLVCVNGPISYGFERCIHWAYGSHTDQICAGSAK